MHDKTLLYGALGATAIATIIGVCSSQANGGPRMDIAPVSLIESSKGVTAAEVPIKLTASDGTGLRLTALKAEAVVEDPLALTELHLTFENPQDRVLEGTFQITLPQGASLSRFAMKVGDNWQEGEVVEKQQARQAYEDFLHRKQDPALMEQGAGNEFSARVFPIPARGKKEIVLTYSESLAIGQGYTLPLNGLPQLGALDVNVHVSGKNAAVVGGKTDELYGVHQTSFTPAGDFVVEARRIPRSPGLQAGNLSITRVIPFATSRPEAVGSAVVMVDTSASRGLGIAEQAKAVQDMLAKLPSDTVVSVALFDQDVVPLYQGKASGFGQKEVGTIVARGALGASNFENALGWAGGEAKKQKATRVIWVTDGVATAGETDSQKLRDKVIENLRGAGVTRMDAIAMGGIRDDAFLKQVVRGVLDRDGIVLDMKLGADAIARRLGEATTSGIPVKVAGAKWSYPTRLDGLQAGDEVLVFAEADGTNTPLKIDVNGQTFDPDLRTIERPLVERAWAGAKIQSLLDEPKENAATTKQQIVALSTRHRVLSPYTALLVLENDWDYTRFNIDRNAKEDILTVQDGRVAITESGRINDKEDRAKEETKTASDVPTTGNRKAGVVAPGAMASAAPPTAAATAMPTPEPVPQTQGQLQLGGLGDTVNRGLADGFAANQPDDEGMRTSAIAGDPNAFGGGGMGTGGPAHNAPVGQPADVAASVQAPPPPAPVLRHGVTPTVDEVAPAPRARRPAPSAHRPDSAAGEQERQAGGSVRMTTLSVEGGVTRDDAQRLMHSLLPRFRQCYQTALNSDPTIRGSVSLRVTINATGGVGDALALGSGNDAMKLCFANVTKRADFPAAGQSDASFVQEIDLVGGGDANANNTGDTNTGDIPKTNPYEGRFKTVMDDLAHGDKDGALDEANKWHADQPGDILSLVALGEVFEARADVDQAARAYGSILELFSFRADSRRFAGERLERLHSAKALALAVDTYAKAVAERPDHPASHRLYAYALLKEGEYEHAFEAMKTGSMRTYPSGRFRGVDRILREDLGLIAAAWTHAQPQRAAEIKQRLHAAGGSEENDPSLRFVLVWETDANDVDFHIHDGKGGHAYYAHKDLPSGGELYADVTTGYGPECFTIRNPHAKNAYPYTLQAHYYSRGPMGYGMGKLEVLEHDGKGNLSFSERPFVVMVDHAYVDMGTVSKDTKLSAF